MEWLRRAFERALKHDADEVFKVYVLPTCEQYHGGIVVSRVRYVETPKVMQ